MPYTQVCPECGFRSGTNQDICPNCGTKKQMSIDESNASEIIYDEIDSRIDFIENPSLYVKILISLIILFGGIFFMPDFLAKSETFWMIYAAANVFTVIKAADHQFENLNGVYFFSKLLLCIYLGAGIGNIIAHTGIRNFPISYYFNPEFLYLQLISKNILMIVGAVAGAGFFLFASYFKKLIV